MGCIPLHPKWDQPSLEGVEEHLPDIPAPSACSSLGPAEERQRGSLHPEASWECVSGITFGRHQDAEVLMAFCGQVPAMLGIKCCLMPNARSVHTGLQQRVTFP